MKAQFLQWKRVTSSQHDEPTHKKPLKPVCLALARLRPNESTALAMKESHLFPAWWANPQKTSETSVLAIVRLRPTESTTLAMKESHREVIRGNVQKQAKVANITARHWQRKTHNTQAFKPAVCHPGLQDAPSGNRTWVHWPKAYSIPLCHGGLPQMAKNCFIEPLTGPGKGLPESKTQCATPP